MLKRKFRTKITKEHLTTIEEMMVGVEEEEDIKEGIEIRTISIALSKKDKEKKLRKRRN